MAESLEDIRRKREQQLAGAEEGKRRGRRGPVETRRGALVAADPGGSADEPSSPGAEEPPGGTPGKAKPTTSQPPAKTSRRRRASTAKPAAPAWDSQARTKLTVQLPFTLDEGLTLLGVQATSQGRAAGVRKPNKTEIIEMLVWELLAEDDVPGFIQRLEAFRAKTGRRGTGPRPAS